jgi:hypothetical protein
MFYALRFSAQRVFALRYEASRGEHCAFGAEAKSQWRGHTARTRLVSAIRSRANCPPRAGYLGHSALPVGGPFRLFHRFGSWPDDLLHMA